MISNYFMSISKKAGETLRSRKGWKKHFANEDRNTTWTYGLFQEMLEQHLDDSKKIIVEIGVARGGHSKHLMDNYPHIEKMFGIDPYLTGYDDKDVFSRKSQREFDCLFEYVKNKLDYPNYTLIREKSEDAAKNFKDESIDAIYIDGDHTFDGVANDIRFWKKKVKPGGIMVGDDYDWHSVKKALQLCLPEHKPISNTAWLYVLE